MKLKTIKYSQNEANLYLKKYLENKNFSDLQKALYLNNVDSIIIFHYLMYLKNNDEKKFSEELKKYIFYLDKDSCNKLNIKYINHKQDILSFINAIQEINIVDLEDFKNSLKLFRILDDKEIIDYSEGENNLPLNDINNDKIFYLSIKIQLHNKLQSLINIILNETNKEKQNDLLDNIVSYIKLHTEIIKNNILSNNKIVVSYLINTFNRKFDSFLNVGSFQGISYSFTKLLLNESENKAKEKN